jgi:hypothetical protein
MLVQSKPGHVGFLPSLPHQLASRETEEGFLGGQALLKSLKWNQKQIYVALISKLEEGSDNHPETAQCDRLNSGDGGKRRNYANKQ